MNKNTNTTKNTVKNSNKKVAMKKNAKKVVKATAKKKVVAKRNAKGRIVAKGGIGKIIDHVEPLTVDEQIEFNAFLKSHNLVKGPSAKRMRIVRLLSPSVVRLPALVTSSTLFPLTVTATKRNRFTRTLSLCLKKLWTRNSRSKMQNTLPR